jgi:hypothetical protein
MLLALLEAKKLAKNKRYALSARNIGDKEKKL